MDFEKWWNENYIDRREIKINYPNKVKLGAFKSISHNTVFAKALTIREGRVEARWLTGGTFDIKDSTQNGYHFSVWIKKADPHLLEKIKGVLQQMGLRNIVSMSENRIHGSISEKYPDAGRCLELTQQFEELVTSQSYTVTETNIPQAKTHDTPYNKKSAGPLIGAAVGGIAIVGVIAFLLMGGISLDLPETRAPIPTTQQTLTGCSMVTFGTQNAEISCQEKTFYLIRDLPLKPAQVNDVTLDVKGSTYTASFDTPLGIPVQYTLQDPNYSTKVYDELQQTLNEIELPFDVTQSIQSLQDSITEVPLMVEHIIQETQDSVVIPDIKPPEIPEIELPKFEAPKQPTLQELRQVALDDINKYRAEKGARPISLGNAKATQLYAQELAQEQCIHHISNSGEGPMLRYKNAGDRMFLVFENIAGGYGSQWNMEQAILDANYDMMFDDAHANWGHRDNIINPGHQSVSIGITFDSGELVMVQDFEQSLRPGYLYHPSSFQKQPTDQKFCW